MSEVILTEPMNSHSVSTIVPEPSVEVFAVYGVEPEIQAYAMAKYSRSSLSMKESLKEITLQKAEKFLNTFYFQYGHRSIADLAHIALAIERLSILAAIVVADGSDGMGRSAPLAIRISGRADTIRPVRGRWWGPRCLPAQTLYRETIELLFGAYETDFAGNFRISCGITPRPAEMKPDAYEPALRARAFDVSRYLLPLRPTPRSARSSMRARSKARSRTCSRNRIKRSVSWEGC